MANIEKHWYEPSLLSTLLLPLAWLFCFVAIVRRFCYRHSIFKSHQLPVPVIVVGNITVGGTGKTPLIVTIVEHLKEQGFHPGIISRGYGGKATTWPQQVTATSDPVLVGDEPVLLAQRCHCPISVSADRPAAARALLDKHQCDVIISDDGLQHYALRRDIEIVVIDAVRGFGNGRCLPAGPLREPVRRITTASFIVKNVVRNEVNNAVTNAVNHAVNNEADNEVTNVATNVASKVATNVINHAPSADNEYEMTMLLGDALDLGGANLSKPLTEFSATTVHAVAAIGNPARFFKQLKNIGIKVVEHPFLDHYGYAARDICFDDQLPVLMTEKDAVKCRKFAQTGHWFVPAMAKINNRFLENLTEQLRGK